MPLKAKTASAAPRQVSAAKPFKAKRQAIPWAPKVRAARPTTACTTTLEREAVEVYAKRAYEKYDGAWYQLQEAQAIFEEAKVHKEMADSRLEQTGGSMEKTGAESETDAEEKTDGPSVGEELGDFMDWELDHKAEEQEEEEDQEEAGVTPPASVLRASTFPGGKDRFSNERARQIQEGLMPRTEEYEEAGQWFDASSMGNCQHRRCNFIVHPCPDPTKIGHAWVGHFCCGKCAVSSKWKDPSHGDGCIRLDWPQPNGTWVSSLGLGWQ